MVGQRKHKCDKWILLLTFALLISGLIILYVVGSMYIKAQDTSDNRYFLQQLIVSVVAMVCSVVFYKVPYSYLRKFVKLAFWIVIALSVLLWIAKVAGWNIANCGGGQCRWLQLGPLPAFQPSELMKLALILYLANYLGEQRNNKTVGTQKFWVHIGVVAIVCLGLVIVAQGDLGTGIVIFAIMMGLLYTTGIKKRWLMLICGLALLGMAVVTLIQPYRMERVDTWLKIRGGDYSINDSSRQAVNALIALGSGGMFGTGIGNSIQAAGWLSESTNDSIFPIIGEMFGLVGLMVVLAMFMILLLRILKVANHTIDFENRTIVIGVFIWLATQTIFNITSMTAILPMTGITLPLISYGGTSVLVILAGIALVLQFSCYTSKEGIKDENISSGRGVRGSRYTGSRRRS